MTDKDRIKSLEKGLKLLALVSREKMPIGLDDLTRLAKLRKTTCFRLLKTMKSLNFIEQDSFSKGYMLGSRLISIGAAALNNLSLPKIALPFMEELRKKTN